MLSEKPKDLILLVGSNPLPNYLAAMALRPSRIHLVYSNKTKGPKERIYTALSDDLGSSVTIDGDAFFHDPFSASAVFDKIRDLVAKCNSPHLHYTGGTKVMAAHALKAFYEKGGRPENASYLDEAQTCLRFDGNLGDCPLSECGVTLAFDRILQLHDIERGEPRARPSDEWIGRVAKAELMAKGSSKGIADLADKDKWRLFIDGEWLEEWVRLRIQGLLPAGYDFTNLVSGVQCIRRPSKRKLEVDIAFVHKYRTYLVSCTTTNDLGKCKQKAFEVAVRSRQLAGDMARSALVCCLDGVDNNKGKKYTDLLKGDVEDVWGDPQSHPTTTRIFGLEDLKYWAGHNGLPNLDDLKNWLTL